jgi:hypothetical protein
MAQPRDPTGDIANVRLSRYAVTALEKLDRGEAHAVAEAITRINSGDGKPLMIQSRAMPSERYWVVVPDDPVAPVVIYRKLARSEGVGYLVTALAGRSDYEGYERAERDGFLESAAGRLVTGVAAGVGGTVSAAEVFK